MQRDSATVQSKARARGKGDRTELKDKRARTVDKCGKRLGVFFFFWGGSRVLHTLNQTSSYSRPRAARHPTCKVTATKHQTGACIATELPRHRMCAAKHLKPSHDCCRGAEAHKTATLQRTPKNPGSLFTRPAATVSHGHVQSR